MKGIPRDRQQTPLRVSGMDNEWMDDGACVGEPVELWFPDGAASGDGTALARTVCQTCPVRAECLEWALTVPEEHGMWGGKSARERRAIRRQRQRQRQLRQVKEAG